MGEPQPSAISTKPQDGVQHTMHLPLHSGATEGSTYAESSPSPSASPDSMRSLSSLSGGRTDSPLDLDMPEGIMGRKVITGEDDSGIQSPDCRPENDNDNSTSIYLDADEQGWCEIRDDQDNVTLVLTHKQGQNKDHSDIISNGNHGRRSSDDSSATDALLCCSGNEEEGEDDEEEDSFLSLTSLDVVMKCQNEAEEEQMLCTTRGLNVDCVHKLQEKSSQESKEWDQMQDTPWRPDIGPMNEMQQESLQESVEILSENSQLQSSARIFNVGHVSELHQEAPQDSIKLHTEDGLLQSSTKSPSMDQVEGLPEAPLEPLRRTDMTSVSELDQVLEESLQLCKDQGQIQSLTWVPNMNPVIDLQESVEYHPEDDEEQYVARTTNVDTRSSPKESVEPQPKENEIQNLTRATDVDTVSNQEPVEGNEIKSLSRIPSMDIGCEIQELMELHNEESEMYSSNMTTNVDTVSDFQQSIELIMEKGQEQSSPRTTKVDTASELQESAEIHPVEGQMQSSSMRLIVGLVGELKLEDLQKIEEPLVEISLPQPFSKDETSIPMQETREKCVSSATITETKCFTGKNVLANPALQNTKDHPSQGHARPDTKPSMTKFTKPEVRRFPRPDLRNVKAKIISRTSSVPRTANSSQSGVGTERKLLPTRGRSASKNELVKDGVNKKSRSSSSQAKAVIPAPVSDPKPKAIPSRTEKRPPPSATPEVVVNRNQEESSSTEVMEEETECPTEEEVTLVEQPVDEIPNDLDQKGSGVKPPKSLAGNVCVPTGVRASAPAGTPKMCGPTSSSSCRGPQKSTSSKLPVKGGGLPTTPSSSSLGSAASENNTVNNNKGVAQVKSEDKPVKPPSSSQGKSAVNKATVGIRTRANSTPVKPTSAGQKTLVQTNITAAKHTHNALQRSASTRPNRPSGSAVEKGSRGVRSVPGRPHCGGGGGVTHTEEEEDKNLRLQNERKNQCIAQLRKLVAHGNRRLEALAVVVQHIFTEREEALKQKKEVSVQLKNLKEELTHSVSCCERLQKEKEEVCVALEAAVLKLQQQHQEELTQLEETLRDFYSAEWDKTHQAYQEEADKYRALMQQQVEELKKKEEALRKEQQMTHAQEMATLKQQYEATLTELRNTHKKDMQDLDNTVKQSEASMNEKLENLMAENEAMKAKLKAEEDRRKALMEKGQKDPHLVYLEQELESLKVVLDIKTSKLHEQDKRIMQMDKLMESNVKLEECLKKLQQENEDYKARMDKHAAMSRQLSTEQAMLQQTLQMESKVNKRLSMENEELLWKLHNGDLSSPRRISPSSPFHSPRNSASFSSAPVSPR